MQREKTEIGSIEKEMMPENDRASYYDPSELDEEYIPWDLDNNSPDYFEEDDD
jgi:hypothetical protein